jgi:hypothetical protein
MKLIISLVLLASASFHLAFTECVNVKGYLKSSNKQTMLQRQKILVYQGQTLLDSNWTKKGGAFSLDFCTGDGTGFPVDFYTILESKDTLLLASLDGFQSDGNNTGNFFVPKKGAPKEADCPKCHQSDKLFTLVYVPGEQKDFGTSSSKFYCSRDKTKFK